MSITGLEGDQGAWSGKPRRSWWRLAIVPLIASAVVASNAFFGSPPWRADTYGAATTRVPLVARLAVSRGFGAVDRSYWLRRVGTGFAAIDTAQRLSERFESGGVEVRIGGVWMGLAVRALGRPEHTARVAAVRPAASRNRVAYTRHGLLEWYANGPLGLEQGFTLTVRPPGSGPIVLSMDLSGSLDARLEPGRSAVLLFDRHGRGELRYTGLSAVDARGRTLRAWLDLRGDRLTLSVDDRGARYPVRVDPYIQAAKLTAGTTGEQVGWSLAMSGNTIVAGAPLANVGANAQQGAVYVFVEPASGWADMTSPTATLTDSAGAASDALGGSVAISAGTIVAGNKYSGGPGHGGNGYVDVFVEPPAGWATTGAPDATLTYSAASDHGFGSAEAVSGDTVVVGDQAASAAYVYLKPGGDWASTGSPSATLLANPATAFLGKAVAVSGNTIVAGAPGYQVGGVQQGAAFVFVKPGGGWSGTVNQAAILTGSNGGASFTYDIDLGQSVAIDGSTIVAGANLWKNAGSTQVGAAFAYQEPGPAWADGTQTALLSASDGATGDQFGWSVGVSGSTIAVGDPEGYAVNGQGAVYVFQKPAGGWVNATEDQKLTASDMVTNLNLGYAVAISAGTIAGSADTSQDGRVYVFAPQTPTIATTSLPPGTAGTTYNATVQASGGSPPYSWSASSLPPGLSIDPASGQITGTPTTAGNYTPTITVTDTLNGTDSRQLALTINPQAVPNISVKLTATIYGDGTGEVYDDHGHTCFKSSAATVSCQPVYYPYGTTVVLHGTASGTAAFNGFLGGGCPSYAITCTITMNGDQTVSAYVNKPQEVSVNLTGTGAGGVTGTPSIGLCGKPEGPTGAVCIHYFSWGTAITLQAGAAPGSEFTGWSGGCKGTGACYLNTAFGTQSVTATFSPAEFHVNAIEITQGVQTPELPTRTSSTDTTVSYQGVVMPWSNGSKVIAQLAEGHPTVVRVYANTATPLGNAAPQVRLSGYRGGQLLAPGPIGPDFQPVVPVGALGSVTTAAGIWQRGFPNDAYTFTLPPDWTHGDVRFVADANVVPNKFPGCSDTGCLDHGLILDGTHFTPVHTTTINPIAFVNALSSPKNYPDPDPMWNTIRQVFPFPIQVNPYVEVTGVSSVLGTCDGQTQDTANNESNTAFSQRVYQARNDDLLADVKDWQTANFFRIGYAFGVAPSGSPSSCTNAGSYSGGVTSRNSDTGNNISASSDDRPKGAAHEIAHGVLGPGSALAPHAGVECGGGPDATADGVATTMSGETTDGSNQLAGLSQPSLLQALSVGQVIEGAGVPYGATIQSIDTAGNAITMSAAATSANAGAYAFPLSGYVTKGGTQLTNLSPGLELAHLGVGEQISGPGVPGGASIQSIDAASGTITMNTAAASTNGGLFTILNDDFLNSNQTGEPWPQLIGATNFFGGSFSDTFTRPNASPADGALDGIGLAGLGNQSNSPYSILYNVTLPLPAPVNPYYDLLSYCGSESNIWISVRNWNLAVAYGTGPPVGSARDTASATGAPQGYQTSPPATSGETRTLAVTDVYDIATGRSLVTTVSPDASAPTAAQPGASYSLTARDASGRVLAQAGAIASPVHTDGAATQLVIVGKVPAAGASEVDVLQDGRPIAQDRASRSAPTVTITAPRRAARIGGPRGAMLRWRSHDADGDHLTVTVRYSPDGGRTWRSIYSGPDSGSVKLPSYLLSASHDALVRLYISDGFYEAIATSSRFVALGASPIVSIASPTRGTRVAAGGALVLAGNAFDDAGDLLTGRALTWRAGSRVIASGAQAVTVDLPAGHYRITLTARDRHGRTASASVPVTVTPSPPTLRLLHAPQRVSSRSRSLTLSLATLAAAKITVDRLHALVGRNPRTLRVAIRPGQTPLTIVLTLHSGPYVNRVAIAVTRR